MAVNFDRRLYTGGAAVFNSQPQVNTFAALLARRQAREDAMNQYYLNLHKNINPAGMRAQDINGGWADKVKEWENHTIQNRDSLVHPKTAQDRAIAAQNESMYSDILMDTQKSKEAAKQELTLGQQKLSGKWNPTQDDMDVAHRISSSIYDDSYYKDPETRTQPYSLNDLSLNVPEFTPLQEQQLYKSASQNIKPQNKVSDLSKVRMDRATGYVYTPYSEKFAPQQIQTIADNYASGLTKSAKVHFENLMHDQDSYNKATKAYQQVYGQDQIIDSPEKMAKGMAASHALAEVRTGEDKALNRNQMMSEWQRKEAIRQADREGLLRMRPQIARADKAANELWIDKYVDSLPETGERTYKTAKGDITTEHEVPLDPIMAKALTKDGIQPDALRKTADGQFRPIWYKRDDKGVIQKTGDVASVDNVRSVPISQEQVKLALGKTSAGTKQTNIEMSAPQKQSSYLIKGKKYSEADLLKMGYTKDQIAPYKQ